MAKQYASPETYETKLEKVMGRLGVEKYNYDWSRTNCWIEFSYKSQFYRFEHSIQNAKEHNINLKYGSDAFAQLVLSLEDLARMVERGIYDLSTWVVGMKMLPKHIELPNCFTVLQFSSIPTQDELKQRYRQLSKVAHPDKGGSDEQFINITSAYEEAKKYISEQEKENECY